MLETVARTLTVRRATARDLVRCTPLAHEFYSETKLLKEFSIDKFCAMWGALIENGTGVILFLEQDGQIIGAISGVAYPEAYSDALLAQEFFLFIGKEHRGGTGLLRLLRAFEEWARGRGCSEMRVGHLEDLQPAELGRLYRRLGFRPIEQNYAKSL